MLAGGIAVGVVGVFSGSGSGRGGTGGGLGPVSQRLMTSQFQDIITHTQKMKTVKCTFCCVWVQNFVWNFKGVLWNFTQNFEPIHRKICILRDVKKLTTYDILRVMTSYVLVRRAPGVVVVTVIVIMVMVMMIWQWCWRRWGWWRNENGNKKDGINFYCW